MALPTSLIQTLTRVHHTEESGKAFLPTFRAPSSPSPTAAFSPAKPPPSAFSPPTAQYYSFLHSTQVSDATPRASDSTSAVCAARLHKLRFLLCWRLGSWR
jgi:hypothetical protein